jgi:hypothetical protein
LPAETALLNRLRAECERRMHSARFRRAIDRPQAAATAMLSVLARVNGTLHASTPSHDDYVTAAASMTAVLVVAQFAYVIHAGATAAYLAHDGNVVPLCVDETLDDRSVPVVMRALISSPALDVSVTSAALTHGDAIVLLGRPLRDRSEREALLERLDAVDPGEHILVARFGDDAGVRPQDRVEFANAVAEFAWLARTGAAIGFLLAAVLTH